MELIGRLIWLVLLGGIVGWVVSLFLGRDFKGGCVTYIVVGIVTMVALGLIIRIFWAIVGIALAIMLVAWVVDLLTRR